MRRTITLLTLTILLFTVISVPVQALASASIRVFVNGSQVQLDDAPFMKSGKLWISSGGLHQAIHTKVNWNASSHSLTVQNPSQKITLHTTDSASASAGNSSDIDEPFTRNGRLMLPLREVCGALQDDVLWDNIMNSVYIFEPASASSRTLPLNDVKTSSTLHSQPSSAVQPSANTASDTAEEKTSQTDNGNGETTAVDSSTVNGIALINGIHLSGNRLLIETTNTLVKPSTFYVTDPTRLVIDIPHAKLGVNLSDSTPGSVGAVNPVVAGIRYATFSTSPATVRIVLDMNRKINYSIHVDKTNHQIVADLDVPQYKVVIDPGHGGHDPGATSVRGRLEKDFTLAVAKKVNQLLEQDSSIQPYLTRTDDTYVSLDGRVKQANDMHADLFVSIHGNIYDKNRSVRGQESYYDTPQSAAFASVMHKDLLHSTGFPSRGIKKVDYRVITKTTMPSVLEEVGYLSNPTDEKNMYNDAFQQKIAEGIVQGIKDYLHQQN